MAEPFYQARLIFCRHGQAQGNLNHEFLGHRDDALTDEGLAQAEHLAGLLADEEIHSITTSPLLRARDTAKALARVLDLPLQEDARLIEQDFGAWEGHHFRGIGGLFPDDYRRWLEDANAHPPTGGETLAQVLTRVTALLEELHLADGRTHVLVGHGSCLQALLCHIMGIPTRAMWPFRLANGSITEVEFTRGGPSMTRLSVC